MANSSYFILFTVKCIVTQKPIQKFASFLNKLCYLSGRLTF